MVNTETREKVLMIIVLRDSLTKKSLTLDDEKKEELDIRSIEGVNTDYSM